MGFLGTFIVIPFGQFLIVADLNVGVLFLMAITGFVALGLMMAGWSSNNKWSLLGGMRSTAQIISYEIPTGLALMVPVVLGGTLSTHTLVQGQGGWPWQWYAFDNPLAFACFLIYFISALAEGNRTPFDLPEAESELVAGYNIEYSGWRFAVFFLSEWGNLFVIGAIATTVFLGGWQIPMVDYSAHASHWGWTLLGLAIFFAKTLTLVFVIIWIRWTLPRFRVDQMMALCWKYFVPWSFAAIVFSALWVWLAPGGLRLGVQVLTFVLCGLGLTYLFFTRVVYNFRQNPEKKFSWNPFY
jgi:NADH-quinone oxidoreductase subunit H